MKIDASSFSLTRIVTFVPFYMLVNRTKHSVFICEEGQDHWTEAQPEQVPVNILPIFMTIVTSQNTCGYFLHTVQRLVEGLVGFDSLAVSHSLLA